MKAKILTLLLVLSVIFSASAQPQRDEFRGGRKMEGFRAEKGNGPMAGLNLTEEQKQSFQTIRLQIQKETKTFRDELRELEAKQQTLTTAEKVDMKAVEKNIDRMSELKASMAKVAAKYHQQMRSQLTEEQRMKFDEFRGRIHEKRGNRMGNAGFGNQRHRS